MTLEQLQKKIPSIKRKLDGGEKKVVIVRGPQSPIGKTTAAHLLSEAGTPVFEEYQVLYITLDASLPE